MTAPMRQDAPYPTELAEMVDSIVYKPEWQAWLGQLDRGQGCVGLTFTIRTSVPNSYRPDVTIQVRHLFPVPAAAYDRVSWRRWIRECFVLVESHEVNEFLQIDGERPYAPNHGPGRDPYITFEYATDVHRRTSFRGDVQPWGDDQ